MSGEHPGDRGVRSPFCSQDSSVTSTSVYSDVRSSSNASPDHKPLSGVESSQSALSESEVSSTSVSSSNAWNVGNTLEVGMLAWGPNSHPLM